MHVELIFYELHCQHCPPLYPPPFWDPKTVGISGHLIAGKVSTWGPPFATPLNTPIEHCNRAAKATKYLLSFSSSWPGLVCLNLAWLGWPVLTWPEQVAAGLKCTWALRLTRGDEGGDYDDKLENCSIKVNLAKWLAFTAHLSVLSRGIGRQWKSNSIVN